ncbi:hypothetical protein XENOCAPTIV_030752 [Xenoophorus captivus]|uniref:Uncharacterized protein n=1 Tax=Xenoophorus captivus TaxID=1517983 RepID=A0ABV0QYH1_9TELE
MSNRLQNGVNSLQSFREDKRNRVTPASPTSARTTLISSTRSTERSPVYRAQTGMLTTDAQRYYGGLLYMNASAQNLKADTVYFASLRFCLVCPPGGVDIGVLLFMRPCLSRYLPTSVIYQEKH